MGLKEDQTLLRLPDQRMTLHWNGTSFEVRTGINGAADARVADILGVVTDVNASGLTDTTKDFEAALLVGGIIRVRHGDVDYFRAITASSGHDIALPALVAAVPAVAAFAVLGAAPSGIATIRCKTAGVAGNAYTVRIVNGTGENQALAVALAASVLTITSATDAEGDPVAVAAGDLEALFAGVPAVDAVFSVDNDITAGTIAPTAQPVQFTSGAAAIPAVTAAVGDEYAVSLV